MSEESEKNQPCPTSVLLYLAVAYRYHSAVDPWYDRIQELSGGATFWHWQFQAAVIYGMFPELKEACQDFKQSIDAYAKSHPFKKCGISLIDKARKRQYIQGQEEVEKDIIKKYNLPDSLDIYNLSDEQKKNIETNLIKESSNHINRELAECSPVVQLLAQALKDDVVTNPGSSTVFAEKMRTLQKRLNGQDNYLYSFPELEDVTKQIFEMRDNGILDERCNIMDFSAFRTSSLAKAFPYEGKTYNLESKINSQTFLKLKEAKYQQE